MVAGKRFTLTVPRIPEAALHQQIARVLSIEIAPPGRISKDGVCWWSVDIANYGGTTPGLRTSRGVIAGVPDIQFLWEGKAYFLELKAKGGKLSEAQQAVGTTILRSGAAYGASDSVEGVLRILDCWEIPRQRRLHVA